MIEADSVNKRAEFFDSYKYKYNVRFFESTKGEFVPERNVLVQNDSVMLDSICFRPDYKAKIVNLKWELFARNIHKSGILELVMKPKFEKKFLQKFVDNSDKMKDIIRILPKIEFDYAS